MLPLLASLSQLGATLSAGSHTLDGRGFKVHVPSVSPAPVFISLHGNGGVGNVDPIKNGNPDVASSHIIVAPDGPQRSWNIKGEESKEDDQLYVGKTLIDHLASFDNVEPVFKLWGFSNGAALTNRILIENDDARITHAITDGSQLATIQYRPNTDGSFYIGGSDNAYTTIKATLRTRKLLQLVGGEDGVILAEGGQSAIGDGTAGGKLVHVPWQDSALAYATAFGYTGGSLATLSPDDADEAKASYLDGSVVAYNFKQVGHVAGPSEPLAIAAVNAFLGITAAGGGAAPLGPLGPSSGGDGLDAECSAACSDEFLNCAAHGTNTYTSCRGEIDDGCTCPLANAGCAAGCTDTKAMAALGPGGGGGGGGLPAAAVGGIAVGAVVAIVLVMVVARKVMGGGKFGKLPRLDKGKKMMPQAA